MVSRAWIRSTGDEGATSPAQTAGLAVAVLCIWLGFDDMMMVHDAVLPGMGIPEVAGLAVYAVIGIVLVAWAFRPLRRERLGLTFLAGLALLGGSLVGDEAEDFFEDRIPPLATFLGHAEDVVKFLAYVALCHLCILLARRVDGPHVAGGHGAGGARGGGALGRPGAGPDAGDVVGSAGPDPRHRPARDRRPGRPAGVVACRRPHRPDPAGALTRS